MNILWFNLATDLKDPALAFGVKWIKKVANEVDHVDVVTMKSGMYDFPSNVKVFSLGGERGYSKFRRTIKFYKYLLSILKSKRINVCFSHMNPLFSLMSAPVLKPMKIPIVTWFAHPSLTWKLKLAHYLSDLMVTSLKTAYPYKKEKLKVIGQGIDTDMFKPLSFKKSNPPLILCVGRLSPVKDHPTLIRACNILKNKYKKDFEVIIIGKPLREEDKYYIESLKLLIKQLNMEDIVKFIPSLPYDKLVEWYNKATIHVNLTPTGYGDKVALEAMACECLSVVANEGFKETLGKYAHLLMFRCGSENSLADILNKLLELPDHKKKEIGEYLRKKVIEMHSLDNLTSKLIEIFEELSQGKP